MPNHSWREKIRARWAPVVVACLLLASPGAGAQVFEVIHPDVEKGGFEFELLNGVTLNDVEGGEERSVHEIALGYSPFSWWKTTGAVELANPEGEDVEVEAYEWENVLLAPIANGHRHDHDHGHGHGTASLAALGLYVALEVPNEGGIDRGELAIGPIAELGLGPVNVVANLFATIPFEDGEDPGLAYALSAAVPIGRLDSAAVQAGFEAHGGAEGLFGDALPLDDNVHVIGPSLYGEIDVGRGRVLEPRLAILFGLTNESPDAVASFNVELKF